MNRILYSRRACELITALLLAAALLLSGILATQRLFESPLYRRSQIIRSIFAGAEEKPGSGAKAPGWAALLTDGRHREVLLKFAGALANAYVSFELIPVEEPDTFAAIYKSLGESVDIEDFSYHRKNLTITGSSPDEAGYEAFLSRLEETGRFGGVTGHSYTSTDDSTRFEIECIAGGQ
ncbi:MAG: hypothetical protein LBU86_02960 [Oscillospiraceae bacterium]|nr:hypothetical protein [Oscillospiraceae bacterium]